MFRIIKRVFSGTVVLFLSLFMLSISSRAEADKAFELSGFVDASYSDADYSPGTFSLDQVEVDIKKEILHNLTLGADLNYLASTSSLTFDDLVEQGYLTYTPTVLNGVNLIFGKFNAPIGFELLDPVDMYQFSHALVFDNGLPTNLTGIMGTYTAPEMIDVSLYIVNGWDINSDNNNSKTVGGRLGITPVKGVNIGFSAISGPEKANNVNDKRTVLDIDFTLTTVENLLIGGEINTGKEDNAGTAAGEADSKWTGYLLMAHYDFTEVYGLTLRYDYFNDKGGSRLDDTDTLKEKRTAYTISPTFALGDGAIMLLEYRYDKSDEDVFNSGKNKSKDTLAIEFTYAF